MNHVRRLTKDDELMIRRFLVKSGDSELGLHRQLTDYFLTDAVMFGAFACFKDSVLSNLIMWSRYGHTTFVHNTITIDGLEESIELTGGYPAEIFLRDPLVPTTDGWQRTLDVTPGFVVDHPAYDGVFSRVAPRFKGAVFRHD